MKIEVANKQFFFNSYNVFFSFRNAKISYCHRDFLSPHAWLHNQSIHMLETLWSILVRLVVDRKKNEYFKK